MNLLLPPNATTFGAEFNRTAFHKLDAAHEPFLPSVRISTVYLKYSLSVIRVHVLLSVRASSMAVRFDQTAATGSSSGRLSPRR